MILDLLAYFAVGLILDIISTYMFVNIAEKHAIRAALGTFFTILIGYSVLYTLVLTPEFFPLLLAYSLGSAAGTWVTMRYREYMGTSKKQHKE